jgi:DNA-binding SARP family transcriptional activator/class 3 adenylate cyclase/predicted negative regulator of RcsB-dependent stress response
VAVEIQLLGRFSARRAGVEIPPESFRGRLVRVLVRLLVTSRGSFVPRDVLADALWPDRVPADPTANLRVLVRRARTALGDPTLIVTGAGGYSVAAGDRCVVDTEVFLAAVEAGQHELAAGRHGPALDQFRSALELWAGEPLPEDAYEDWAREARARLSRAYLVALEAGAEAALGQSNPGQAVMLAERAVAREPLREPATVLLARALAASGDQVAALRAIDSLRRRLAEEVGLELSPAALALETRLQRGQPLTETARTAVAPSPQLAFEGLAFVGRDDELEAVLRAVRGPDPGAALVCGGPGAGKSRLLAEAAARLDVPVLRVRAFPPDRNEPWSLARALLREALALDLEAARAIPERAAQALADVLPELEEVRSIANAVVDSESRRALALEGAARMMEAAAGNGAVVVADDLQWADATSLAVLGLIARRVPRAGLALAYRSAEATPESPLRTFVDALRAMGRTNVEIALGPLTPEALSLLVPDEAVAGALAEETDRTPLALVESIRRLNAERVIAPDVGGRWEVHRPDAAQRARDVARTGQRRAIAARVGAQPPDRRQLLSLLSLVGREAPARVFARATGAGEGKILDDLDTLARAGLARLGDAGWAPAHDLIGEVVVEGLERAERGRLHQVLARAVAAESGDPADVARHLAGAGDRAAAAAAFSDAAQQRLLEFAGDEATQLADAGLDLDPQPAIRTGLLRTRAQARALRGDLAGARDDLRAALASIPRGPERAWALTRIAELTPGLDDYVQAGELIEVALAEAAGDPAARAEALAVAAIIDVNRGDLHHAEARAAEALSLFERLGDLAGVASVLDIRSLVQFCHGDYAEVAELMDRAARLYRDSGRLLKVGSPRCACGWALALGARAEEGLREVDRALELERTLGQTEGEAYVLWVRSEVLAILGRVDDARADAEAARALGRAVGNRENVAYALRALGWAHAAAGDLDRAETALRQALETAGDMPFVSSISGARLAAVLARRGDLDAAESYALQARRAEVALARYEADLVLAEVALERGDPDGPQVAAEALEQAAAGAYLVSPTAKRLEARVPPSRRREERTTARHRQRRTFMVTDIVQSTNLLETLGDEAWDHLLRWHDQTLRALFAGHHGEEVNRIGDGFFVAFQRAEDGVRCAIEIQRVLDRHRVEAGFAPRVRIGLHEAEATREGADYQGKGVHEAARIAALAGGDEILASHGVVEKIPALILSEPRPMTLKGISKPVELVSISWK